MPCRKYAGALYCWVLGGQLPPDFVMNFYLNLCRMGFPKSLSQPQGARDREKTNLPPVLWGGPLRGCPRAWERWGSHSNSGTRRAEEQGLLGLGAAPRTCVRQVTMWAVDSGSLGLNPSPATCWVISGKFLHFLWVCIPISKLGVITDLPSGVVVRIKFSKIIYVKS